MPLTFSLQNGAVLSGEEMFIILMYHLLKGKTYTSMARGPFGGNPRKFSFMFKVFIDHLYMTFYNNGQSLTGTSPPPL